MADQPAFISLDQPHRVSRRVLLVGGAAAVAFLGLALWARFNAIAQWPPLPVVPTLHAFALAIICGLTGLILWSYGLRTRLGGYLLLSGAYLFQGGVLLYYPIFYPNGLKITDPPTTILGGPQAAPWLYLTWHVGFVLGVAAATLALMQAAHTESRQLRRSTSVLIALALVVALVAAFVVAANYADDLPTLLEGNRTTALMLALLTGLAWLTVAVTVLVAVWAARRRSTISLWVLVVMVVALGESTMTAGNRYSALWYGGRATGLIAGLVLLVLLIAELARMGRKAETLAVQDQVTGLLSRAAFLRKLDERLAGPGQPRVVLLLVDLDEFKSVNDRFGHPLGDLMLQQTAERIVAQCPASAVVGRLGGDEFGVLLDEEQRQPVADLVRGLLEHIRQPIRIDSTTLILTASIGAASVPDAPTSAELISDVDLAMYAAKHAGGNQCSWYEPEMSQSATAAAHLRQRLSAAIDQRAFALDYQPIVETSSGRTIGAEALVRWLDGGERVAAGRFVPQAEDCGLIRPIGRIVLDLLAAEVPDLLAVDPLLQVSFNLSVDELADAPIIDALAGSALGDLAANLTVEVTESTLLSPGGAANRGLTALRDRGFAVAVDDFGTGYSSLHRLEQLRPDIVKADRSLVVRAGTALPTAAAFLAATVTIADSLGARVIAEGVETEDEAGAVCRLGIREAQGYRYGRPMPLAAFLDRLRAERRSSLQL